MSAREFTTTLPMRFGDADPAGILYYPRLLHFCHAAMEEFFAEITGETYAHLLSARNVGFPTVHLDVDYFAPMPYGTDVHMSVTVKSVGSSSLTFRYRELGGGERPRAEVLGTTVCVDMRRFTSIPIPDDLCVALSPYLEADG